MNVSDYVAEYEKGGLPRLNAALVGLDRIKLTYVLKELRSKGFDVAMFADVDLAGTRPIGIVVSGP